MYHKWNQCSSLPLQVAKYNQNNLVLWRKYWHELNHQYCSPSFKFNHNTSAKNLCWNIYMGQVTKVWISCYLVLLSVDSKVTRQPNLRDLTHIICDQAIIFWWLAVEHMPSNVHTVVFSCDLVLAHFTHILLGVFIPVGIVMWLT